jgi:hypothetical protein
MCGRPELWLRRSVVRLLRIELLRPSSLPPAQPLLRLLR